MIVKGQRDAWYVGAFCACASILAFSHFFLVNEVLMYGDAVAHINIARRVFDSRTPGLDQLGTVWLPLPHLLTIPFITDEWMWRSGAGGSLPSMIAYIAGVLGVFRLVRDNVPVRPRGAAWMAAIAYGANPNLLYMQATAMTEPLSLALFIWAVVFFADFVRAVRAGTTAHAAERSLWWCALMLSAAMLTRYDGWFAAFVLAAVLAAFVITRRPQRGGCAFVWLRFALLIAIVPAFWFAYNYKLYGNPLEFANGPYSARAIAARTARAGDPPYPGKDHPLTAALYFVKAAKLNLAGHRLEGEYSRYWRHTWQQDGWAFIVGAGTIGAIWLRCWPPLLLWIPLPFYALSIAYGGVPIFIPSWWPFSYYNVRYGLQLLPLAAVCAAMLIGRTRWPKTMAVLMLVFIAITYAGSWREDPVCLREAIVNSRTRIELDSQLTSALLQMPTNAAILMYTGEHVGALEAAGIPLRRTINENNYYDWRNGLQSAEKIADYAVGFDDDAVSRAVRSNAHFAVEQTITVEGQPTATIYHRVPR
jgi:hypothetical protein